MKTVKAVRTTHICVTCGPNDTTDIKCGGPATLGYDFYVDPKKADGLKKHIEKELKKYNRPCWDITIHKESDLIEPKNLWDKKMITTCIKTITPL